ncbi:LpqN/LpqT family lipoprotein [Demequina gelatinilytica]|uniref:LpqN/LpqT family lipoprotein n=1 Tax=Demequina gelatinilytica TaxID=1638980 RepID=UPI0012E09BC8|nr:hypothetical protein [Demequina gelatinilytica]
MSFPSETFPALSGFSIDVPDGWVPDPASGLQFAVRPRDAEAGFLPNLTASVRRQGVTALENAIAELDRRAAGLTDYTEAGRGEALLDGHRAFHVEFSYRHSADLTLAQMVTLVVVERGSFTDLVQVTATCAGDQVAERWEAFRRMDASLIVSAA